MALRRQFGSFKSGFFLGFFFLVLESVGIRF